MCQRDQLLPAVRAATDLNALALACLRRGRRNLSCLFAPEGMAQSPIPFMAKCTRRGWRLLESGKRRRSKLSSLVIAGMVIEGISPQDTSPAEVQQALANVVNDILGTTALAAADVRTLAFDEGSLNLVLSVVVGSNQRLKCAIYLALGGHLADLRLFLERLEQDSSVFPGGVVGAARRLLVGCPGCRALDTCAAQLDFTTTTTTTTPTTTTTTTESLCPLWWWWSAVCVPSR